MLSESQELLAELLRREKEAGITPDPDVDLFMKVHTLEHKISYLKHKIDEL